MNEKTVDDVAAIIATGAAEYAQAHGGNPFRVMAREIIDLVRAREQEKPA